MAYTNGVFRIDLVSGSDAARTALTSCTASNPSGSITNIQKTAHGLVTGAVVDLTLFTAWLNSAWKITVVDADNFTLDDATWQATADTSGTVTPRGGSSWSDAWLTIGSGATAARIQPGDEMRISKTADPVSLGQDATWTDGSQTVTLTTAVTKKIDDSAGSTWTVSANITGSSNTSRKIGANAQVLTPATGFTTGKVAYILIAGGGTEDFSAYEKICFWFRPTSNAVIAASTYKICLCSDATGDTIVNEINIPATLNNTGWHIMELDYGAALGSSIQSVAIYANSDPGTTAFSINNIFATNDLSLKTLIGKTGDVNYNIQSIDGTTIKIDSNNTAATGRGYSGATSTETLYYRVPFDVTTTGSWAIMNENGAATSPYNHYIGGYNTTNDTRDGVTCIASALVGVGTSITCFNFCKLSYFTIARFSIISVSSANNLAISDTVFCGGAGTFSTSTIAITLINCKFLNLSATPTIYGGECVFLNCEFRNISSTAIAGYPAQEFISCTFANNTTASIAISDGERRGTGAVLLRNCILLDTTEILSTSNRYSFAWSYNHDDTPGNHWGFTNGATINMQSSVVHSAEPVAWKFTLSSSASGQYRPATLRLGPFPVEASALVTVTAWIKKDHATNVGAKLYVQDELYNIDGVVADSATKADDTSWEELTITFTPTEAGVVPVFVDAWYADGASNVYVGSITLTQA
jgi:hypothetical protein